MEYRYAKPRDVLGSGTGKSDHGWSIPVPRYRNGNEITKPRDLDVTAGLEAG